MSAVSGYVLGVESAIAGGSLSLHHNGVEISSSCGDGSVSRAEELLPHIDSLLREYDVTIRDLDVIIVSTGPGSYTGIRVGIATVIGLRAGIGAHCLGVTILQAMKSAAKTESKVMTSIPMGRNMVCSQLFEGDHPTSMPKLNTTEEFVESAITFTGSVVVHRSLFDAVKDLTSGRTIDAGDNLASMVATAVDSGFATEDLTPLFVDRQ